MKLCLACFKVCEDSVATCPHCGYGSADFKEYPNCLPIGTKLGGRFTVGGVCSLTEDFTSYYACDMQSYKRFKVIEYAPRSLMKSRKGAKIIYIDEESRFAAEDYISKLSALNISRQNSTACFEENSSYYIVEAIKPPVPKKPAVQPAPVKKVSKKKGRDVARKVVLALCIICIVVSIGYLFNYYLIEPMMSAKRNNELAAMMESTAANVDPNYDPWPEIHEKYPNVVFPEGMNPDFADLYALNPEVAGRVKIPGTDLDLVVMQTTDNDKYLKTDFDGNETNYGQPYFDYRNNIINHNRNTVIYGHNMRHDDKIFGALEAYRNIDTFINSPIITLDTLYGSYTYKIYAVYIVNTNDADDVSERLIPNFIDTSDMGFIKYIEEINKRTLYHTGVDILPTDNILTLYTCCYDFSDARLVVVARQVRGGESAEVDTSLAVYNTNPKYPQAYYDAANLVNPYKDDENVFVGY